MALPAGFSSEDDFSDNDYSFATSTRQNAVRNINSNNLFIPLGQRLLVALIEENNQEAVRLIKDGADVNFRTKVNGGWTPLMHACYKGSKELVSLLLEYGAAVNDHHEMLTPLMCVSDSSCTNEDNLIECIELLIQYGANIHAVDWCNTCILTYAVKSNHEKVVCKLINLGCKIDIADTNGWTPLFYAADSGRVNMVRILKDAGANISKLDNRGISVHELAMNKYYNDIAELVSSEEILDDEDVFEIPGDHLKISSYQKVLRELPNSKLDRFHGFHTDALVWIQGIHLKHLTKLFIEKNIQLSDLFIMNEEQLKNIGIDFSFDRKKILVCAQSLLEHRWSKNCIRGPRTNEGINLLLAAQILSNMVRHMHLISIASYLCRKNGGVRSNHEIIKDGLFNIKFFRKELQIIFKEAKKIEAEEDASPPDYILPKTEKHSKLFWISLSLGFISFIYVKGYIRLKSF